MKAHAIKHSQYLKIISSCTCLKDHATMRKFSTTVYYSHCKSFNDYSFKIFPCSDWLKPAVVDQIWKELCHIELMT